MITPSRRTLITGLGATLFAAPAIVRAESLMKIRIKKPITYLISTTTYHLPNNWEIIKTVVEGPSRCLSATYELTDRFDLYPSLSISEEQAKQCIKDIALQEFLSKSVLIEEIRSNKPSIEKTDVKWNQLPVQVNDSRVRPGGKCLEFVGETYEFVQKR